jgi:hypothetical protein
MSIVIIIFDKTKEGKIPEIITDNILLKGHEEKIGDYMVKFKEETQNKKLIDVFSCDTFNKYKQYETMHDIEVIQKVLNYSFDDEIHNVLF